MDQIPLCLVYQSKDTFETKGKLTVAIRGMEGAESGEKRFCTLTLTLQMDVPKECLPPRPILIFRGRGKTQKGEFANYHKGVDVQWQKKAWTDDPLALEYLDLFQLHLTAQTKILSQVEAVVVPTTLPAVADHGGPAASAVVVPSEPPEERELSSTKPLVVVPAVVGVLFVDGLAGHKTPEFVAKLRSMGMARYVLPGGETENLQPVDKGWCIVYSV